MHANAGPLVGLCGDDLLANRDHAPQQGDSTRARTLASEDWKGIRGWVNRVCGSFRSITRVIRTLRRKRSRVSPRGMEFLYSLNRLNVATSRAQAVVIVVGSPRLLASVSQFEASDWHK